VADDGNTVAWYDYSDLTTLTKDTGGTEKISQWNDKLGSGHNLTQATGTKQPIWHADGVRFNNVAMYMATAALGYSQPEMIYLLVSQVSYDGTDQTIINGAPFGTGTLYQHGTTPDLCAHCGGAGATVVVNSNLAIGNWGVVRILFNTANSKLIVDETAAVTGHFGSSNMNAIALGGDPGNPVHCADFVIREAIFRDAIEDAGVEAAIYQYLKKKVS